MVDPYSRLDELGRFRELLRRPRWHLSAGCMVRRPCLAAALARNEEHGIWGGTSEADRRSARRHGRTVDELLARADQATAAQ
jgi:Transcription factor WhiB